jgi:hypothetical protein
MAENRASGASLNGLRPDEVREVARLIRAGIIIGWAASPDGTFTIHLEPGLPPLKLDDAGAVRALMARLAREAA